MAIIVIIASGCPSAYLSSTSLLRPFIMLPPLPIIGLPLIITGVITQPITHRVIGFGSRVIGTTDRLLMAGKGPGFPVTGNGDINPPWLSMDGGRLRIGSGREVGSPPGSKNTFAGPLIIQQV